MCDGYCRLWCKSCRVQCERNIDPQPMKAMFVVGWFQWWNTKFCHVYASRNHSIIFHDSPLFFLKRLQFLQFLSYFIDLLIIAVSCLIYRVTCVIMNDFERENFYVVNFINRETLHRSIGMINKITWRKYYTDSCSATIIILGSVATPKNCIIMRRHTTALQAQY